MYIMSNISRNTRAPPCEVITIRKGKINLFLVNWERRPPDRSTRIILLIWLQSLFSEQRKIQKNAHYMNSTKWKREFWKGKLLLLWVSSLNRRQYIKGHTLSELNYIKFWKMENVIQKKANNSSHQCIARRQSSYCWTITMPIFRLQSPWNFHRFPARKNYRDGWM